MIFERYCRYCGQVAPAGEFDTLEAAMEDAAWNCTCAQARAARGMREQIERGWMRVDELFGPECEKYGFEPLEDEDAISCLKDIVTMVVREIIGAVGAAIPGAGSARIKMDSEGRILIERRETRSYRLKD